MITGAETPGFFDGANAPSEKVQIPGVDDAVVAAAGIRHCEFPECEQLTGSLHGGMLFTYRNIHGFPVNDGGAPYCRIRLDQPRGDQKYAQRAGTGVHPYIPPGFALAAEKCATLVVIEGEKKSVAAASEGFPAIGISGFYGVLDGKDGFTDELIECLRTGRFEAIIFLGDSDVIFNPQFSDAVVRLIEALSKTPWVGLQVFVGCVPADAPGKGLDDVRAVLGNEFRAWFEAMWNKAFPITPDMSKGQIALRLLEVHRNALEKLAGSAEGKDRVFRGLAKLAAGLADDLVEEQIRTLAESLGFTKRAFGQAVTRAKRRLRDQPSVIPEGAGVRIDLTKPAGEWAREVLQALPDKVYLTADGKLAQLVEDELLPFSEKELISYLDRPDRFIFVHGGAEGQVDRLAKFEKKHAEIVVGAVSNHPEVLRRVRVFSKSPVLVDRGEEGCALVAGYCPKSQILVASSNRFDANISLEVAWAQIENLLADFQFESDADRAVALASILTPALVKGGFLNGKRVPFIVIWKDQKGAGGGYFCQVVCGVHSHRAKAITVREPSRVYESISRSLFNGDSIIYLDNIRGAVLADLPFLESILTEPVFDARMIYRHGGLDVTHLTLMATSNGMTLSDDLANRALEIRIRKQPHSHSFRNWEEGDLLSHIEQNSDTYLACVHTIIRAWVEAERPMVKPISGIRFKEWERVVGGILTMHPNGPFDMFPEGERGRRRMMDRMSSPDFDRIEALCRDLVQRGHAGQWLTAREMVELIDDQITVDPDEHARLAQQIGIMLSRFCQEVGVLKDVGERFKIQRNQRTRPENNYKQTNEYCVVESTQLSDDLSTLTPGGAG